MRVGLGGISGTNILSIGRGVSVGGGGGFVGPYDAVPSITAAYGVRRLLSSYTGPILRLRRDSDNTEQDIGYVANGDLDTAAAATFLDGANGYVTTWYDQSGSGYNATQATAANQPLYVANVINGHSVLRFDGSNDRLELPSSALGMLRNKPAATILAVRKHSSLTGQRMVFTATTGTGVFRSVVGHDGGNGRTGGRRLDGDGYRYRPYTVDTNWHSEVFEHNWIDGPGAWSVYIDGVLQSVPLGGATGTTPTPGNSDDTNSTNIWIGAYAGSGGTNFFNGDLAELVVCDALLDALVDL